MRARTVIAALKGIGLVAMSAALLIAAVFGIAAGVYSIIQAFGPIPGPIIIFGTLGIGAGIVLGISLFGDSK